MTLAEWEDREFERIRRRLNIMRRRHWFAAQEDEEFEDPDSTPEPLLEAKIVRVCSKSNLRRDLFVTCMFLPETY